MAAKLTKKKLSAMRAVIQQFGLFTSLLLQLHGLIYVFALLKKFRDDKLLIYYATKRTILQRKLRHIQMRKMSRKRRTVWVNDGRTEAWWLNMIKGILPEDDWKRNFRMTREKFCLLCEQLRPYLLPGKTPNYRLLSVEKKVAVTLYYLKDTGSLWMTANTFGIHQCTVSKTLLEVCRAISTHLGPEYLHLPRNHDEMQRKVAEFETKFGMVQAFGCVGGTHIPIRRPIVDSQDYFNYKQYFSLNVQEVCDFRGLFIDVECRWPGSVHDAKVFSNSHVHNKLKTGNLSTCNSLLPGHEKIPNYLIGDPAYPLTPYCMKEYQSCKSNEEVLFNNILRSARNPIECAFGRLKARWSILTRKMDLNLPSIPTLVLACFVLHNFCEINNDHIDAELVKNQIERNRQDETMHKNIPDPVYSGDSGEGEMIRQTLTEYIKLNMPENY